MTTNRHNQHVNIGNNSHLYRAADATVAQDAKCAVADDNIIDSVFGLFWSASSGDIERGNKASLHTRPAFNNKRLTSNHRTYDSAIV